MALRGLGIAVSLAILSVAGPGNGIPWQLGVERTDVSLSRLLLNDNHSGALRLGRLFGKKRAERADISENAVLALSLMEHSSQLAGFILFKTGISSPSVV
jgi:hypothetical protein